MHHCHVQLLKNRQRMCRRNHGELSHISHWDAVAKFTRVQLGQAQARLSAFPPPLILEFSLLPSFFKRYRPSPLATISSTSGPSFSSTSSSTKLITSQTCFPFALFLSLMLVVAFRSSHSQSWREVLEGWAAAQQAHANWGRRAELVIILLGWDSILDRNGGGGRGGRLGDRRRGGVNRLTSTGRDFDALTCTGGAALLILRWARKTPELFEACSVLKMVVGLGVLDERGCLEPLTMLVLWEMEGLGFQVEEDV
mmetsp:Transcript_18229/g.25255  ORF Transcript_18229/g.25255 Transcript_18229/m.25255 type:complete len:254 (-) Transcript_18229:652-1413(-)